MRSGIRPGEALVLGWLGPRGLASIVFGLLAFIDLSAPDSDLIGDVMVATVLVSIVLHGLSLGPIAARYGRRATASSSRMPEATGDGT
jgi:NhaP-type Na+/H+ or K+/H+ antiporter